MSVVGDWHADAFFGFRYVFRCASAEYRTNRPAVD